jgi:hypothetical protein
LKLIYYRQSPPLLLSPLPRRIIASYLSYLHYRVGSNPFKGMAAANLFEGDGGGAVDSDGGGGGAVDPDGGGVADPDSGGFKTASGAASRRQLQDGGGGSFKTAAMDPQVRNPFLSSTSPFL